MQETEYTNPKSLVLLQFPFPLVSLECREMFCEPPDVSILQLYLTTLHIQLLVKKWSRARPR